jgi:hypothetical protein
MTSFSNRSGSWTAADASLQRIVQESVRAEGLRLTGRIVWVQNKFVMQTGLLPRSFQ